MTIVFFTLMPDKTQSLKELLLSEKNNVDFNPKTIMTDFEQGFQNALRINFPRVVLKS